MNKEEFIHHFEEVIKRMGDHYVQEALREGLERYRDNRMSVDDEESLLHHRKLADQANEMQAQSHKAQVELFLKYNLPPPPDPEVQDIADSLTFIHRGELGGLPIIGDPH